MFSNKHICSNISREVNCNLDILVLRVTSIHLLCGWEENIQIFKFPKLRMYCYLFDWGESSYHMKYLVLADFAVS
jgi:hypothetical protein